MSVRTLITADQLLRMPDDGRRFELVAGELREMTPAGWEHGLVGGRLHALLTGHVVAGELGEVFLAETGFLLARDPDTVRAPDIAFIRRDHFPDVLPRESYWPGAPDLAVEIVSPSDTIQQIDDKAKAWLAAGAMTVWVVNPAWRSVTVHQSATDIRTLNEEDELTGGEVVPGFRCKVADIFTSPRA